MPDVPLASLAPPSPLQQQVAGFPAQAGGMMANALGITDAMRALRGEMTPEEAQGFALSALPGLIPGAGEAGPLMRGAEKLAPEAAEAAIPLVQGIRAFHGSPYDFDKFDLSKIGTGEGAQAYGHGLYFAENPGVANSYKEALTGASVGGRPYNPNDPIHLAVGLVDDLGSREAAIADLQKRASYDPGNFFDRAISYLQNAKSLPDFKADKGRMYEVNIAADPEHFLDWDKPLSEQSPQVRDALVKAGALQTPIYSWQPTRSGASYLLRSDSGSQSWGMISPAPGGFYVNDMHGHPIGLAKTEEEAQRMALDKAPKMQEPDVTKLSGQHAYYGASNAAGDVFTATNKLRQAGIPGIKYLDQGSRGSGAGTHNYVVFDSDLINIIKKYGLAGLIAGGGMGAMMKNQVPLSSLQQ